MNVHQDSSHHLFKSHSLLQCPRTTSHARGTLTMPADFMPAMVSSERRSRPYRYVTNRSRQALEGWTQVLHHNAQEFPLGYSAHPPSLKYRSPPNIVGVQKHSPALLKNPCTFTHHFYSNEAPALKYAPSQFQTLGQQSCRPLRWFT